MSETGNEMVAPMALRVSDADRNEIGRASCRETV